jgi:hypothetical protein
MVPVIMFEGPLHVSLFYRWLNVIGLRLHRDNLAKRHR